jgi:hypothetical protein
MHPCPVLVIQYNHVSNVNAEEGELIAIAAIENRADIMTIMVIVAFRR